MHLIRNQWRALVHSCVDQSFVLVVGFSSIISTVSAADAEMHDMHINVCMESVARRSGITGIHTFIGT